MDKEEHLISIVVPAYNEESELPNCLKSLKARDYADKYEMLVVDKGSTDTTAAIAKEFGVRVILGRKRGTFYAREAGVQAVCGDIIIQADADTIYSTDWLSRISHYFDSDSWVVAIVWGIYL